LAGIEVVKENDGVLTGTEEILNVGAKVGKAGTNKAGDVIVVQSLLAYYRQHVNFAPFILMGRPNGVCDQALIQLIAHYQGHVNADILTKGKLTVDGVVGRAKGKTHWAPGKKWTIISLNDSCRTSYMLKNGGTDEDYISDVRRKFPEMEPALSGVI
jgi:hypothetical protein